MPGLRVMIVDDSEAFRAAASTLLTRQGMEILPDAASISQALRIAPVVKPDVVLVDVMLAGESGLELTRRLCAQEGDGCPPMILVSTHTEDDLADVVADTPAVGFLAKSALSAEAIQTILAART